MSWIDVAMTPGDYYRANTTFYRDTTTENHSAETAVNQPRYQYTWTSPQISFACKSCSSWCSCCRPTQPAALRGMGKWV